MFHGRKATDSLTLKAGQDLHDHFKPVCLRLDSCSSLLPLISLVFCRIFSPAFNMFLYAVTLENQDLLYDPSSPQNLPSALIIF